MFLKITVHLLSFFFFIGKKLLKNTELIINDVSITKNSFNILICFVNYFVLCIFNYILFIKTFIIITCFKSVLWSILIVYHSFYKFLFIIFINQNYRNVWSILYIITFWFYINLSYLIEEWNHKIQNRTIACLLFLLL